MGLKLTTGDPENFALLIQVVSVDVEQLEGRRWHGRLLRSEWEGSGLLVNSRGGPASPAPSASAHGHRARQEPASN